jgi:hypothetical protein
LIYLSHGVVPRWSIDRISHALFVPERFLSLHLQRRCTKYVPLSEALEGRGDALTIDDATYGGLQAALLARRYGHAVSWFVNGMHVEYGLPYFPFQLSCMLDDTLQSDCEFDSRNWRLRGNIDRRVLRQHLKHRYMRMRDQEEIYALVDEVSRSLNADPGAMEKPLRTVTPAEIGSAVAAGIDVQNHGWSHLNPVYLSDADRTAEALLNEAYLSQFRDVATRVYAPPFGSQVSLTSSVIRCMLLANRQLGAGHQAGNIVNRQDLLKQQPAIIASAQAALGFSVGAQ